MPTLTVIGAGTMGAGIAQIACAAGWHVNVVDIDREFVEKSIDGIKKRLQRMVEKGRMEEEQCNAAIAQLRAADGASSCADNDLIIEAVVEDLGVKVEVLSEFTRHVGEECIIASNTSSLSITKMAEGLGNHQRVIGMHFFNPVPLLPLVEIIDTPLTAEGVSDQAVEIAKSWGKTVVRCKDTPGFIVNRVARGYYLEAMRMLGEGVAPIDQIDNAMKSLGGFRMGPFELMDLVGIDVNYTVSCSVYEQKGRPNRLEPHPIQAELYDQKLLGKKTGQGFYEYGGDEPAVAVSAELNSFGPSSATMELVNTFAQHAGSESGSETDRYVFARILGTIINEASLAMDEGVASADDIDTAMKTGTNYPNGPLEWAKRIGHEHCLALLQALNTESGDGRFTSAKYLEN